MRCTRRAAVLAFVCAAGLLACSERGAPPRSAPPRLATIQGVLVARSPSVLPPRGRAVVELRDASNPDGAVVAEQRIDLRGAQPPIRFTLAVDPARLQADRTYAVRGGIEVDGRPAWVGDAVPVDPMMESIDVGELPLKPRVALAFATTLRCGDREVSFGVLDDAMHVVAGDESIPLRPVAGGPGGRYEAANDRTTTFTITGDWATLVVRGETWPECIPVNRK